MTCKYCGAQTAPDETVCSNRACLQREVLEMIKTLTPGETWAVIALVSSARPGNNLQKISRPVGDAAISVLQERFLPHPEHREEAEQAISWLTKCMDCTEGAQA